MKRLLILIPLLFIIINTTSLYAADEIVLKNGTKVAGAISEQSRKKVIIDPGVGTQVTYYADEIETINGEPLPQGDNEKIKPKPESLAHDEDNPEQPDYNLEQTVNSDTTLNIESEAPATPNPSKERTRESDSPQNSSMDNTPPSKPVTVTSSSVSLNPMPAPAANYNITQTTAGGSNKGFGPIAALLGLGIGVLLLVILLLGYIIHLLFYGIPLFIIAKKTDTPNPWTALVPIIGIFTIIAIAKRPWWWGVLMFVPLVNIVVYVVLSMDVADARWHSKWLGLLILVPVVNIFLYWFFALADGNQKLTLTPQQPLKV